jgi:cardiolipin synthase
MLLTTLLWLFPHLALIIGFLLAAVVAAHMLRQRHSPAGTTAWLLAMVLLPYIGVPLYLALGGRKMRRMVLAKAEIHMPAEDFQPLEKVPAIDRLLRTFGLPGATRGNRIQLCRNQDESYAALISLIEDAQTSLAITTYILSKDELGRDILGRLASRAAAGVKVRLLLDGYGSLKITRRFLAPLLAAGGQCGFFIPVLHRPLGRGRTNLRNHRKIIIADDRKVMAGGINIAGEYIGQPRGPETTGGSGRNARPVLDAFRVGSKNWTLGLPVRKLRENPWQDLAFTLEGPSVRHYAEIFRSDWKFATREQIQGWEPDTDCLAGNAVVQVVPSGPDVPGDPLYGTILSVVFMAKKRLWIVTPYFVPDHALVQALCLAAQRGVDVRVMVPAISNHRLTDSARGIYLREVQAAGGKILLYTAGMLHAKTLLMDDELVITGSANFDFRSLFLNFEAAVIVYGPECAREIEAWFLNLSQLAFTGVPPEISPLRDIYEGVIRMAAPLL